MKKILILLFILLSGYFGHAIGYFKIKFTSDKDVYYGLLLYYDDKSDLNLMRITFKNEFGDDILVEEKIKILYNKDLGAEYRILRGYDIKILINSTTHPIKYYADIFKFKKTSEGYFEPDYQESNVDELGNIKGQINYFKAIDDISKKDLKWFGWGKYYRTNVEKEPQHDFSWKGAAEQVRQSSGRELFQVQYDPPHFQDPTAALSNVPVSKVHLIIISNTVDEELGTSCKKNESGIDWFLGSVVLRAGCELDKIVINEKDFNLKTIDEKINALSVRDNEGVLLYYSGHGFRTRNAADSFPYLELINNTLLDKPNDTNTKRLKDLYDVLVAKNPLFCIVIAECCNNEIDLEASEVLATNKTESLKTAALKRNTLSASLTKKLLEFRGSILVSTASPTEKSYYYPQDGGVFWNYLRDIMHNNLSDLLPTSSTDWLGYLEYAKKQTNTYVNENDTNATQNALWLMLMEMN